MTRTPGIGFLAGLKGYNPLVLATQFSVQVDLVVAEPVDAGSVERALLAALLTDAFPYHGMATVTAKAIYGRESGGESNSS